MKNMRQLIHRFGKTAGHVGIEIEVEGINLPNFQNALWHCDMDGSLRGESMEYILNRPVDVDLIEDALGNLKNEFVEVGAVFNESFRAGVHVHVNCQEMEPAKFFNFVCLYLTFEDVLVNWCGENRKGNLFCLRTSDADYTLGYLRDSIRDVVSGRSKGPLMSFFANGDLIRYSSMNFNSMWKYGSLEFRALRSTKNFAVIESWAKILKHLQDVAMGYDNPQDIIHDLSVCGIDNFSAKCLGEHEDDIFGAFGGNVNAAIMSGMRNAQEIAFAVDWAEFSKCVDDERVLRAGLAVAKKPVFNGEMAEIVNKVIDDRIYIAKFGENR